MNGIPRKGRGKAARGGGSEYYIRLFVEDMRLSGERRAAEAAAFFTVESKP